MISVALSELLSKNKQAQLGAPPMVIIFNSVRVVFHHLRPSRAPFKSSRSPVGLNMRKWTNPYWHSVKII